MDLNKSYIFGIGKHHTLTSHSWFLSKTPFSAFKMLKHYVLSWSGCRFDFNCHWKRKCLSKPSAGMIQRNVYECFYCFYWYWIQTCLLEHKCPLQCVLCVLHYSCSVYPVYSFIRQILKCFITSKYERTATLETQIQYVLCVLHFSCSVMNPVLRLKSNVMCTPLRTYAEIPYFSPRWQPSIAWACILYTPLHVHTHRAAPYIIIFIGHRHKKISYKSKISYGYI